MRLRMWPKKAIVVVILPLGGGSDGSFFFFIYFFCPTSRFRGPDTLWRVPWNRLLGNFLFYPQGCRV